MTEPRVTQPGRAIGEPGPTPDRPSAAGNGRVPTPPTPPTPPTTPHAAPARRGLVRPAALVVLLAGGGWWGWTAWQYARTHVTTDNAQVDGHVTPVIPKVGGYIDRVYVTDNQLVRAGDTLFTIDHRDFSVRVQQTQADLASAVAAGRQGSAEATVNALRAQRAALDANVLVAEANFERTTRDLVRFRTLAAQDIASQSQLDAAEAAQRAAAAQVAGAREQAAGGGATIRSADFSATSADRRTASLAAALDNARLQLSYTVVTAPVSGRITRRTAEIGQLVNAGQQVMAIVRRDSMWVMANLKETQLADVRVGQPVSVTVDAYPGHTWDGHVESIQQATGSRFALLPPDNATGNFTKVVQRVPVKILLANAGVPRPGSDTPELAPGLMSVVAIDVRGGRLRTGAERAP